MKMFLTFSQVNFTFFAILLFALSSLQFLSLVSIVSAMFAHILRQPNIGASRYD